MVVIIISLLALFLFYLLGGFGEILERLRFDKREAPPEPGTGDTEQTHPEEDRKTLERIAANYWHYSLTPAERAKKDIWGAVREASTEELRQIIRYYEDNN